MTNYISHDQSKEKYFQYFSENFAYKSFDYNDGGVPEYSAELKDISLTYEILMESCVSPIERIMAVVLLFSTDGYLDLEYQERFGEGEDTKFKTIFSSQHPVLKYTADFLIRIYVEGEYVDIAIECDGHDFHEKTKQQASKDKRRDRDFAKEGIIVLRFSGSDIYSKTKTCANEISDFINLKKEELMVKAGFINHNGRV